MVGHCAVTGLLDRRGQNDTVMRGADRKRGRVLTSVVDRTTAAKRTLVVVRMKADGRDVAALLPGMEGLAKDVQKAVDGRGSKGFSVS